MRQLAVIVGCLVAFGTASVTAHADAPLRDAATGFVGYVPSASLPLERFERWPGTLARQLSADAGTGRLAVRVEIPPRWRSGRLPRSPQSIELIVLDGSLRFGGDALGRWDFAFVPPGAHPPRLRSDSGATLLVFFDPAADDVAAVARQRERGSYVTRFDPSRWQPASLARAAGATADLRVMHLKKDPFTTARSWYVKLAGGMQVPWEVHGMVEEGYLMEGRYRLAECLPDRTVIGDYATDGYFWRPGGIPHSGPDSGPLADSVWLQRSPVALDVVFYGRCEDGAATAPVTPPVATTRTPSTMALPGNATTTSPAATPPTMAR
jgi:hypothetical protein